MNQGEGQDEGAGRTRWAEDREEKKKVMYWRSNRRQATGRTVSDTHTRFYFSKVRERGGWFAGGPKEKRTEESKRGGGGKVMFPVKRGQHA